MNKKKPIFPKQTNKGLSLYFSSVFFFFFSKKVKKKYIKWTILFVFRALFI